MFPSSTIRACILSNALALAVPCSAQPWTEARVMGLFSHQSLQAISARAQVAVTRAEARGRALYSNPNFAYSREGAGFTEFFQAEQALPLSGRIGILRQAVRPAAAAAEAEADALIWQLRAEARQAFYRLLGLQERAAIQRAAAADLQEVIRVLATREKEGEGSRFDRLRRERELVEVQTELTAFQAQAAQSRARLLEFLPPGTEIVTVDGTIVSGWNLPALPELVSRALAARSEIRATDQLMARLQLDVRAASRLRYPEPVIAAGLKRADVINLSRSDLSPFERTQNGTFVGVTIPIPSFNRGQAEVSRLQAEQTRIEAQRRALEHQIRAQVSGAYQVLALRRELLDRYRQEVGATSPDLAKIAQVAYQEGEVGILELLDVFRLNRQSQHRLIELGAAVREAQIELDRAIGEEVMP